MFKSFLDVLIRVRRRTTRLSHKTVLGQNFYSYAGKRLSAIVFYSFVQIHLAYYGMNNTILYKTDDSTYCFLFIYFYLFYKKFRGRIISTVKTYCVNKMFIDFR